MFDVEVKVKMEVGSNAKYGEAEVSAGFASEITFGRSCRVWQSI
jgi:hypothetical protein